MCVLFLSPVRPVIPDTPAVVTHPTAGGLRVEGGPKPHGVPVMGCAVDSFPPLRRLLQLVPERIWHLALLQGWGEGEERLSSPRCPRCRQEIQLPPCLHNGCLSLGAKPW